MHTHIQYLSGIQLCAPLPRLSSHVRASQCCCAGRPYTMGSSPELCNSHFTSQDPCAEIYKHRTTFPKRYRLPSTTHFIFPRATMTKNPPSYQQSQNAYIGTNTGTGSEPVAQGNKNNTNCSNMTNCQDCTNSSNCTLPHPHHLCHIC